MESKKNASEADSAGNIKISEEDQVPPGDRRQLITDCEKIIPQQLEDYRGLRDSLSATISESGQPASMPPLSTTSQPSTSQAGQVPEKDITKEEFQFQPFVLTTNFGTTMDISSHLAMKMDKVDEDLVELDKKVVTLIKSNEGTTKKLEAGVESLITKVDTLQADVHQLREDVTGFKTSIANIEGILKTIEEKWITPAQPNIPGPSGSAQLERKPVPVAASSSSAPKRKGNREEDNVSPATKLLKMTEGAAEANPEPSASVETRKNSLRSKRMPTQETQPQHEGPMTRQRSLASRTSARTRK